MILLPKNHAADLFELPEKEASSVIPAVQKIAAAVKKATGCAGVNILQNNGECAGQTVFHFHVHVIPREKEDSIKIGWKTGTYEGDDSERTAESIRKHL